MSYNTFSRTTDYVGSDQHLADLSAFDASLVDAGHFDDVDIMRRHALSIAGLPDDERDAALINYYRSDWWHPALMLEESILGTTQRRAYQAVRRACDRSRWTKRWYEAPVARGRASIARLTGCASDQRHFFATAPFRTIIDDDGENIIAAAVGFERWFEPLSDKWLHIDINTILLWNPRRRSVRIAGEETGIVLPADRLDIVVYANPAAFFSAWAMARLDFADRYHRAPEIVRERCDNELPGALVVGNLDAISWITIGANSLKAGPGVDRDALSRSVLRAAHLPKVERI